MSFIHEQSREGMPPSLDLFEVPLTMAVQQNSRYTAYSPLTSLAEQSSIEFDIPSSEYTYLDLSRSYLQLKVRIVSPDGIKYNDDRNIGPVNLLLHSLFSQVDIYLNSQLVSTSNNLYAYKSYLQTLLNYSQDKKKSILQTQGFYEDTPGHLEDTTVHNAGFTARKALMKKSSEIELVGRLNSELFSQERLLPSNTDLKIKLTRTKDSFALMGTVPSKLEITECFLFIRRVEINPELVSSQEKVALKTPYKFILNKADVRYIIAPAGSSFINRENLSVGDIPSRVVIAMVSTEAFQGNFNFNPFNMRSFGLQTCSLYLNGVAVPSKRYDLSKDNVERIYYDSFEALDLVSSGRDNGIDLKRYKNGSFFVAFDLTPSHAYDEAFLNPLVKGSLRFEAQFNPALPSSVVILFYMEVEGVLQLDKNRQVV